MFVFHLFWVFFCLLLCQYCILRGLEFWAFFFVGGEFGGFYYLFCLGEQAFCLFVCFGRLVEVCFPPHEYWDAALFLQGEDGGGGRDAVMRYLTPSPCLSPCFPGAHPCWILPLLLCVGSMCKGLGRGGYEAVVIINNCESDPVWAGL